MNTKLLIGLKLVWIVVGSWVAVEGLFKIADDISCKISDIKYKKDLRKAFKEAKEKGE